MRDKKQCLIITATITPNSNFISHANPKERRTEYLEVLKYYITNYSGDIYFTENSAYNFDDDEAFQNLFKQKNVFFLNFQKSTEIEKGKGYQEFKVLDELVSKLENKYDEFIKVTGRYLVTNFNTLAKQENKGIIIDRHEIKKVAITSFFKCNMDIYQSLIKNSYKEVNDAQGIFIEHIIYKRLKNVDLGKIDLFIKTPLFKGVSGSYGGSLNRHQLKIKLINIERALLRIKGIKELKKEFK
jgi:hypothetical protein